MILLANQTTASINVTILRHNAPEFTEQFAVVLTSVTLLSSSDPYALTFPPALGTNAVSTVNIRWFVGSVISVRSIEDNYRRHDNIYGLFSIIPAASSQVVVVCLKASSFFCIN